MDGMTLGAVVGRQVRAAREAAGRTQDEAARAARAVGLDWSRAAVASLETGRRGLSGEELLLLPAVLGKLTGGPWRLADLFPPNEWVEFAPGYHVRGEALRDALEGTYYLGGPSPSLPEQELSDELRAMVHASRSAARFGLTLRGDASGWFDLVDDARTDVAAHAAGRLGVDTLDVVMAARKTWGRGLVDEREARVADRAPAGASRRSLQAIRGHVVRELLAELAQVLEEVDDG